MIRSNVAVARAGEHAWIAALAVAACVATGAALVILGPIFALVLVGGIGVAMLVRRPGLGLAALLVTTVVLEADRYGFLSFTARFYEGPPSASEVLMATAAIGILTDLGIRHRLPFLPEPFTIPLAVLSLGFLAGAVTGQLGGGSVSEIFFIIRPLGYLLLVSFLVVNLVRGSRAVRTFAAGAIGLAIYKGFEGTTAWVLGAGRHLDDGGVPITYYEPTSNFLMMLFLLGVASAALMRVPLPLWAKLTTPLVLASFALSFRRNFWIGGMLALVLVVLLTSGVRGRRLVFPVTMALGLSIWLAISIGGATRVDGPLVERARTLSPTSIEATAEDRYRLEEAKNVLDEIRASPIAGLGIGIPWSAVDHPLPIEHEGGRHYTHVILLWYWLKMGLLGLAGYLLLMGTAVAASVRLWRAATEPYLRVAGLALTTGLIGLMVAELTGSFTGVNYRFSILLGAILGWLAAASMALRASPPTADP